MTSDNDSALERYGAAAQLGPALSRAVADAAAAAGRETPDRRTPAQRLEAERRRTCRQASRALDRQLAAHAAESARVRRELDTAERNQEFDRVARLWLADIERALDYADQDEIRARIGAMDAALGRVQNRSVA